MTTAITELEIHLAEQARLVTEIIDMMVGITVQPSEAAQWPPPEEIIHAAVSFDGAWAGAMIFECTLPLAFEFTARFMSVPLPQRVDDDVQDSLGELANMIAGNFKALLPPGSLLSIPEVRMQQGPAGAEKIGTPLCHSVFQTAFGSCCLILESKTKRS